MALRLIAIFALFLLTACQFDAPLPDRCAPHIGTYRTRWTEISGDCGPQPDALSPEIWQLNDQDIKWRGCTGTVVDSKNNCRVTQVDIRCQDSQTGYVTTSTSVLDWSREGSHAVGEESLRVNGPDGELVCYSTYKVERIRL